MSKVRQLWERGKILKQWQTILKEHPSCHLMWKNFLDFNQSNFASFGQEETRKQYPNCLDILHVARNNLQADSTQHSNIFSVQVYVLLRLTFLLRKSGYVEIGVAMWQALTEFLFNKPQRFHQLSQQAAANSVHDASALAFEEFCNSETPRIGEPKPKGWLSFNDNEYEFEYEQSSDIAYCRDSVTS